MLGAASLAHADVIPITWDAAGRFEQRFDVAPGKFAEACERLRSGTTVEWRFETTAPADFNIHYHAGEAVVTPAQETQVQRAHGTLRVASDQDYCWMWSNKGAVPISTTLSLGQGR
ncbi:MAG: hypothetical protein ABI920_08860 [Casimicrobiaceae bacterium]